MPYDAYTGDAIHQFFQMCQQMDCAIDGEQVSRKNPTGCLHDLQSAITTTYSTPIGGVPHDATTTATKQSNLACDCLVAHEGYSAK